jgi:peptidoglycan/LPS O-acetylase OafA/YrhL
MEALTGLRFAAAFAILLFHYGAPLLAGAPPWAERVRAGGHVWVGLFYVLSGFVLARSHPQPMSPAERRTFWVTRLGRLYPAYLLAFVLSAPFALERWQGAGALGSARAAAVALAALLLVQAWFPPIARLWNAPGWSTSVVLAFYAAFPFAAAVLTRLRRRGLWLALAGAWALSLGPPLAWLGLRPDGPVVDYGWNEPGWLLALKFHPLARAGEFVAGVALGLLHARGVAFGRLAPAAPLALAAGAAVLAWGGAPFVLLHNGLLVPLFAVAVLGLAEGRGAVARAFSSPPARALGEASVALYALQEPLWLWARRLLAHPGEPPSPAFALAFAACAVLAALVVSRTLERPARRAIRALFAGDARGGAARPPRAAAGEIERS